MKMSVSYVDNGMPMQPLDRYKVVVELVVRGESVDDAQEAVKEIIQHGIIGLIDNEDCEPIEDWDITEAEPAEVL